MQSGTSNELSKALSSNLQGGMGSHAHKATQGFRGGASGGEFSSLLASAAAKDPQELLAQAASAGAGGGAEVGKQFEELIGTQLVREMRRSLSDGFFGGGAGSDTYDGWLDEHLGKALARGGDFGLSATIRAQVEAKQAYLELKSKEQASTEAAQAG